MRFYPIHFVKVMAIAMAASVLALPAAFAEEKDEVDPRVSEAMSACLSNNLEKGIGILAQLYAETQDALWVFNQARCYQQNNKLEDARTRFLEFRRKNRRKDKARDARAQEYVAEIEKELERRDKNVVPAEAPAKIVAPPKAEPVAPVPQAPAYVPPAAPFENAVAADLGARQTKVDEGSTPIYGKWWFWAGVGGVLVASVAAIAVATSGTKTVRDCGLQECDDVVLP